MIQIKQIDSTSLERALAYLQKHEDTSMFLLSNLLRFGPHRLSHPYSGDFKIVEVENKLCGIYCVTCAGTLLINIDTVNETIMESIYRECLLENILPKNVIASFKVAENFSLFLEAKKIIKTEKLYFKEIIYSLDLYAHPTLPTLSSRLLKIDDYPLWSELHVDYLNELSIPNSLSPEQTLLEFKENVYKQVVWGTFHEGSLVSIAELNAMTTSTAQLGGVYTPPKYRNQGFAKKTVQTTLYDCKVIHKLSKAIIFTDVDNLPARSIYESLQATPVGYLGIFFGTPVDQTMKDISPC